MVGSTIAIQVRECLLGVGTTVRVYKDGHVVQIDKLGNSISKFPDGRTIKMIKSDVGVVKLEEHKVSLA